MANVEWNIPFTLKTPQGELDLNVPLDDTNFCFLLRPAQCFMQVDHLRSSTDDVPQGDGGIPHPTWRSFYTCKLAVEYWVGETAPARVPACEHDRRAMHDLLMLYLNSLVRPSLSDVEGGNTQLIWTPSTDSTLDDRMLNRITLVSYGPATDDGESAVSVEFELRSEFPYAMDKTERQDFFDFGEGDTTLTNDGTTDFYPVFRVHGEIEAFSLENESVGLRIDYDGQQAGAQVIPSGQYVEIDTFRNTAFLNGNGADLLAGIDITTSDFWWLQPGANNVIFDAPVTVFWQAAWF